MTTRLSTLRSLKGPVIMFVIAIVLAVTLLVLWNVVLALDYQRIRELASASKKQEGDAFHTTFIALGSVLFVATISLLSIIGAILFKEISFSRRLSDFIATFTHELNSPLASIKLFAQTLQHEDLPKEKRDRFLELVLADVERLRGQISNVLRAAQAGSPEGLQVRLEPIELNAYLEAYVQSKEMAIEREEKRASLAYRPGPESFVGLDPIAFRQALDNLVDNALKYGHASGVAIEMALLAGSAPETVTVLVRDDGIGVVADDLKRIFLRFGRGRGTGERARKGTGLGLWIVHAIIRAHNGSISASSPGPGRGMTLRMELPRGEPAPREARNRLAAEAERGAS